MPVPIDTISRLESTSGDPAFSQTRRLSTVDIFCRYRQPAQFDPRQLTVEILEEMPADADRKVVLLDERIVQLADSTLSVEQRLPGAVRVGLPGQSSSRYR